MSYICQVSLQREMSGSRTFEDEAQFSQARHSCAIEKIERGELR